MYNHKKNFFNVKNMYSFLDKEKDKIMLIAHVNNLNNFEDRLIQNYCTKNDLNNFYVKSNLIKKITKNFIFLSLFKGPTKLFFFKNFHEVISFYEQMHVKKKILPLAIYWKNSFFSYSFFFKYIEDANFKNKQFLKELPKSKNVFVSNLSNTNINLIKQLNFNKLFLILNKLKINT